MGLTIFHIVFLDIPHIHKECGEYPGILRGLLSIPLNIGIKLNNVMPTRNVEPIYYYSYCLSILVKEIEHYNFSTLYLLLYDLVNFIQISILHGNV